MSEARQRLLDAAVAHARTAGIADLSLREIAEAVGSSHRMLLYHFGSREGLLTAVAQAVEAAERALLLGAGDPSTGARDFWARSTDPALAPQERLFFELYVHALRGRPGTEGFLEHVIDDWTEPVAARLVADGVDPQRARHHARLGVAVMRGLLLDLLATGDLEATTAAFDTYLEMTADALAAGTD